MRLSSLGELIATFFITTDVEPEQTYGLVNMWSEGAGLVMQTNGTNTQFDWKSSAVEDSRIRINGDWFNISDVMDSDPAAPDATEIDTPIYFNE